MNNDSGHVGGREIAIETMVVIVVLAAIAGVIYFWNYVHNAGRASDTLISIAQQRLAASRPTKEQLAASLLAAQAKLAHQSADLTAMKADFPSSPELDKQITDAYAAAIAAIAKTDKLFNDPDSANPTLKNADSDPAAAAAIAVLRRKINDDMAAWASSAAGAGSTLVLSQAALADLATMQDYLNQLQNYFDSTPPSNALQSDVIIAYQGQLADDAAAVNGAINKVDEVGAPPIAAAGTGDGSVGSNGSSGTVGGDLNTGNTGVGAAANGSNGSNVDNGSGGGSSSGSSNGSNSGPSSNTPPIVTVGDILAAQAAIDQTGGQIQSIDQQINNYDTMPPVGDQGSNVNPNDGSWGNDPSLNGDYPGQPWVPQNTAPDQNTGPQLIQGDNPIH